MSPFPSTRLAAGFLILFTLGLMVGCEQLRPVRDQVEPVINKVEPVVKKVEPSDRALKEQ